MSPTFSRGDRAEVAKVLDALCDPLLLLNRLGLEPKQSGGTWNILCPWHDEANPSCNLKSGARDGHVRVKCFSCGAGGDAIDLTQQVQRVDFPEALRIAAGFVGVSVSARAPARGAGPVETGEGWGPGRSVGKRAPAVRERVLELHDALMNDDAVLDVVMRTRALPLAVIEQAQLGYDAERRALAIPYVLDRMPKLIKFKLPKGSKPAYLREPKGQVDLPYGVDLLSGAERVIVCEGELDALVLRSAGVENVVSAPNGAQSATGANLTTLAWLDHLERFADIVVLFDGDDAGKAGATQLAQRLGIYRCRLVKLPSDVLTLEGGIAKDPTDFALANAMDALIKAIDDARAIEHPLVEHVDAAPMDEFADLLGLGPSKGKQVNIRTGIVCFDETMGGVRRGELTVIYGAPSAGKSILASEILIRLLAQGLRCLVVSLEMTRAQWIARMALRLTALASPTQALDGLRDTMDRKALDEFRAQLRDAGLYLMRAAGNTSLAAVLDCIEFSYRRYDVEFVVIDHLQRLSPASATEEKDWRLNDEMTGELETLAHRTGVGIVAPSHVTTDRRTDRNPRPTLLDGRGGKGAAQSAACIVGLWRRDTAKDEGAMMTESAIAALKLRDGIGIENRWTAIGFDARAQGFFDNRYSDRAEAMRIDGKPVPQGDDNDELVIGAPDDDAGDAPPAETF